MFIYGGGNYDFSQHLLDCNPQLQVCYRALALVLRQQVVVVRTYHTCATYATHTHIHSQDNRHTNTQSASLLPCVRRMHTNTTSSSSTAIVDPIVSAHLLRLLQRFGFVILARKCVKCVCVCLSCNIAHESKTLYSSSLLISSLVCMARKR